MFKLEIMYNHALLELLTNFHSSFDEYHINDTLEVNIQQYIMDALGTAICVRTALNTGYYKQLLCCTLQNISIFFYSEQRLNWLHIAKNYYFSELVELAFYFFSVKADYQTLSLRGTCSLRRKFFIWWPINLKFYYIM